jgi:hypothetical protein
MTDRLTVANGIWRRRYELSKQLQDLHTDVALLSETHLKPHVRFFIPNHHFYQTDRFPGRNGIPHNHVDLCHMCEAYSQETHPSSRQRPYYIRTMTARVQLHKKRRKQTGREPREARRQDKLTGGEPPVVKQL